MRCRSRRRSAGAASTWKGSRRSPDRSCRWTYGPPLQITSARWRSRCGRGRFFEDQDVDASPTRSALIDEKFAQRFWPHENPIGKQVWFNPQRKLTIVGVVGAVKQYGLEVEGRIVVYLPAPGSQFLVRAHCGRSRSRSRCDPSRDPRGQRDDPRLRHPHHGRPHVRLDGAAAILHHHAGSLRRLRVDPGGGRSVRRNLVPGHAGNSRSRRADRAGAQRGNIVGLVVRQGMELALLGSLRECWDRSC